MAAYTHSIPLPPDRAKELDATLGFMTGIGYLRMEEVPDIPVLPTTPGAVVYAPLGDTPVDPDVVLFWGPASRVMLLQEAAIRAGVSGLNTFGRPTCMAVPAALALGMVASTGCVGNRVYTGAEEGEMYAAVPGKDLARLAETTSTIKSANVTADGVPPGSADATHGVARNRIGSDVHRVRTVWREPRRTGIITGRA